MRALTRWTAVAVAGACLFLAGATAPISAAPAPALSCATGWDIDTANGQCDGPVITLPDGYQVEQVTGPGKATMVTWENAAGTITGCSGLDDKGHAFTC